MPAIEPEGFYNFRLRQGTIEAQHGARMYMLSAEVLAPLVTAAVGRGDLTPMRKLGTQLGEQLRGAMGGQVADKAPEEVLGGMATGLALLGWGTLTVERWGPALVAAVENPPELDEERLGVAAMLGGLFSALIQREVACVPAEGARFILVDPSIAEEVWDLAQAGSSVASIVERLKEQPR